MNHKIIPFSFILLALAILFVLPGGQTILKPLLVLGVLGVFGWLVETFWWVRVPALTTAVSYNHETKGFMRLLPPGRHWLRLPLEHIIGHISTAPTLIKGNCSKAQTNGGIQVTLEWSLAYVLNPTHMAADLRPAIAKTFTENAENLIRTHVNNCIQLYVSQQTVAQLYNSGARGRIERELREIIAERLRSFGVQPFRLMLHAIELPALVRAGLEEAQREELRAAGEAHALERLHEAIHQFSDEEMTRLLQLKQLDELGENGVAVQIPLINMNGEMVLTKAEKENGRSYFPANTPPNERSHAH